MKKRILRAALTLVVPIVIEYVIKKITEKKQVKDVEKPIPSPH